MKDKHALLSGFSCLLILSLSFSCNTNNETQISSNGSNTTVSDSVAVIETNDTITAVEDDFNATSMMDQKLDSDDSLAVMNDIANSVPSIYKIDGFWIWADFDDDGLTDYLVKVRGTDEEAFVKPDWGCDTLVDRNPRGYLLVMNRNNRYVVTSYNYECFPSENEDGGVYFPPELFVEYDDNHHCLIVSYGHGRYGSWDYRFKYRDGDFVLVAEGRDESASWIVETLYLEYIDYEKGIKKCSELENPDDVAEKQAPTVYKDWEEKIEKRELVKMSEKEGWY